MREDQDPDLIYLSPVCWACNADAIVAREWMEDAPRAPLEPPEPGDLWALECPVCGRATPPVAYARVGLESEETVTAEAFTPSSSSS